MTNALPTLSVTEIELDSDIIRVIDASTGRDCGMTFAEFARIVEPTPSLVIAGATYVPIRADTGRHIRFTSGSAVTVTFPNDNIQSIPVDYIYTFEQAGAGVVSFAGASGVTINYHSGFSPSTGGQHACVQARKTAQNVWLLMGLLAAA